MLVPTVMAKRRAGPREKVAGEGRGPGSAAGDPRPPPVELPRRLVGAVKKTRHMWRKTTSTMAWAAQRCMFRSTVPKVTTTPSLSCCGRLPGGWACREHEEHAGHGQNQRRKRLIKPRPRPVGEPQAGGPDLGRVDVRKRLGIMAAARPCWCAAIPRGTTDRSAHAPLVGCLTSSWLRP